MLMEPHHRLPFLSMLPQSLANTYMRITGKGSHYHEKHVSYWALLDLCSQFELTDYSARVIANPTKFAVDYMLPPGSWKQRAASLSPAI